MLSCVMKFFLVGGYVRKNCPISINTWTQIFHGALHLTSLASKHFKASDTTPKPLPLTHLPGQYHWVASLAPSHSRLIASWFTGWINIGGQIVLTASAAFAAGLQFQAYITLNDESGSYVPQRWQGMLFYWLVIAYSTVINIFGSRVLPHTNTVSGVAHVVGFVATVVVMGVMGIGQQGGHSAEYVFKQFENSSGWGNDGVSWLVGMLSAVYPFLG